MDGEYLDRRAALFWWIVVFSIAGIVMVNKKYGIIKSKFILVSVIVIVFVIELMTFLELVNYM